MSLMSEVMLPVEDCEVVEMRALWGEPGPLLVLCLFPRVESRGFVPS